MALVKIQKADIELANVDGMTPLMLVAEAGNTVLVDVSSRGTTVLANVLSG